MKSVKNAGPLIRNKKEAFYLKKKKDEITIRSSVAEYLTYVASVGDQHDSIEMCYENENIWLPKMMLAMVLPCYSVTC